MNITGVRVRKINAEGRMKAIVSITLDDCFAVHDIKVIEGEQGLFVAMPSKKFDTKDENGVSNGFEFKDIVHPINPETRKLITDAIVSKYQSYLAESEVD